MGWQAAAVDGGEDVVAAAGEQSGAGVVAEFFGIVSVARVAQDFGAVGIGDDGFEMEFPFFISAKAPMGTWQPPPNLLSRARSQVVVARAAGSFEKYRDAGAWRVAFADLDSERSLAGGGTHDFGGDDLLDQFRFAEAIQAGGGQDDGVVVAASSLRRRVSTLPRRG